MCFCVVFIVVALSGLYLVAGIFVDLVVQEFNPEHRHLSVECLCFEPHRFKLWMIATTLPLFIVVFAYRMLLKLCKFVKLRLPKISIEYKGNSFDIVGILKSIKVKIKSFINKPVFKEKE